MSTSRCMYAYVFIYLNPAQECFLMDQFASVMFISRHRIPTKPLALRSLCSHVPSRVRCLSSAPLQPRSAEGPEAYLASDVLCVYSDIHI